MRAETMQEKAEFFGVWLSDCSETIPWRTCFLRAGATYRRQELLVISDTLRHGGEGRTRKLTALQEARVHSREWMLVYRVDSLWIEGNVVLDRGDGGIRRSVSPNRIHRSLSTERNAVVGAVALVGAVRVMVRAFQQRHVDILAGDVLDRPIRSLCQRQCISGVGNRAARYRHGDARRIPVDRIGWSGPDSLIDLVI